MSFCFVQIGSLNKILIWIDTILKIQCHMSRKPNIATLTWKYWRIKSITCFYCAWSFFKENSNNKSDFHSKPRKKGKYLKETHFSNASEGFPVKYHPRNQVQRVQDPLNRISYTVEPQFHFCIFNLKTSQKITISPSHYPSESKAQGQ